MQKHLICVVVFIVFVYKKIIATSVSRLSLSKTYSGQVNTKEMTCGKLQNLSLSSIPVAVSNVMKGRKEYSVYRMRILATVTEHLE